MNFKSVSTPELLFKTKALAATERKIGIEVLHHLREIDARKAFAIPGYSSLFDYCVRELGYSEGSACRRIQAMKLIREIPEYGKKLEEGAVNVATLSQAQTFFNQEKKQTGKKRTAEEKIDLLKKIEGLSSKKAEKVFATELPELAKPDQKTPINERQTEIRFTADEELLQKLDRLTQLLGKNLTTAELLHKLADLALRNLEKKSPPMEAVEKISSNTRYIPAKLQQAVRQRDQNRCTYTSPDGKRCEAQHDLKFEHVVPFARGGKTTFKNLTLLCLAHNQLAAIHAYGLPKMQEFWSK